MAGNLGQDTIQLQVIINGGAARKELTELNQSVAKLKETQRALRKEEEELRAKRQASAAKGDVAAVQEYTKALDGVRTKMRETITELGGMITRQAELRKDLGLTGLSLSELRVKATALKAALSRAVEGGEQYQQLEAELVQVEKRIGTLSSAAERQIRVWDRMRKGIALTDMTMEQLELEVKRLQGLISRLDPNDKAWKSLNGQLQATESRLKTLSTGLGPFGRLWAEAKSQVAAAGVVLGGMFAAGGIVSGFQGLIQSSKELSDSLADVRKTTGLSMGAVRELARDLGTLDTRTARKELLQLATDAGKLGISAKDDVLQFVRAGNQINVALGEDLGADAIKNIGKLVDLFKLSETFGLEGAMLKVGSAVNELGMASTASEGYLVDFMKRMGGIAPLAGITIDQTLALGATLDSLGQTSEVSSTALSKLFVKLGSDAEKYAKLAGMSTERFRNILQNNALKAFIAVLEGTKKTEGGIMSLTETLGDMGIDAARAAGVFGVLSNNTDRLRQQMAIANRAFREGSSITDEYNIRNTNLAANIEKLSKEFNKLFANTTMVSWLDGMVNAARESVNWLQRNASAITIFLKLLGTAIATWATYRITVAAAVQVQKLATAMATAGTSVWRLLTGQISLASIAMRGFNTATKLNPFGLLLSGITAVVGAMSAFKTAMDSASLGIDKEMTDLQALAIEIRSYNVGTAERTQLVQKLKDMYPEYLSSLDAERATNEQIGRAVEYVNAQLINKLVLERYDQQLQEQNAQAANTKAEMIEAEIRLRSRLFELSKKYNIALADGIPLLQQAKRLQEAIGSSGEDGGPYILQDATRLGKTIREIEAMQRASMGEEQRSLALIEKRKEVMRSLGMAVQESTEANQNNAASLNQIAEEYAILQETLSDPEKRKFLAERDELDQWIQRMQDLKNAYNGTAEAAWKSAEDQVRSVGFLNEQIKTWQEKQQSASDPEAFQAMQREIDRLEAERDRITGAKASKRAIKEKENLDKLLAEYREFQIRLRTDRRSEDERELAELDAKHREVLRKTKEDQEKLIAAKKLKPERAQTDLKQLDRNQEKERAELIEQQGTRRLEAMREMNERLLAMQNGERDARLQAQLEAIDQELEILREEGRDTIALEQQKRDLLITIYTNTANDAIAAETKKWDAVIEEARKRLAEYEAAAKRDGTVDDGEAMKIAEYHQQILDAEKALSDAKERINNERRRREAKARRDESTAERMEYARRIQYVADWANALGSIMAGAIQIRDADIQIAEQRADIDGQRTAEEIANIERLKAARRRAALNHIAVQAAAAVASAVSSALASPLPFPGNLLAAAPAVGTVLGLIAQARAILAEGDLAGQQANAGSQGQQGVNVIPYGAEGLAAHNKKVTTSAEGGAVLGGNLHSDGGNTLYDNKTGRPLAEVEKDELMLVMSRKATAANADLIPAMLRASREGKRLTTYLRDLAMPSPRNVQRAMGVAHMAMGGAIKGGGVTYSEGTGIRAANDDDVMELLRAIAVNTGATVKAAKGTPKVIAQVGLLETRRRTIEYERMEGLAKGERL